MLKKKYNLFEGEKVLMVDVDDTLIMWDAVSNVEPIEVPGQHWSETVYPNEANIHHLKIWKNRGAKIVVWSQGGYEWAEAAVKALKLDEFVDMIMSKPTAYMDDLDCKNWIGSRIYKEPK